MRVLAPLRALLLVVALLATAAVPGAPAEAGVDALADLTVQDVAWSPPDPVEGGAVALSAWVANAGNASAANFTVQFQFDGADVGLVRFNGTLPPGNRTEVACCDVANLTAGNHTVRVVADAFDVVPESDETNNARAEQLVVRERATLRGPDLRVLAVAWGEAAQGTKLLRVRAVLANTGDAPAGASHLRFEADEQFLGEVNASALEPGRAVEVVGPLWAPPLGEHRLRAIADILGEVAESDEANNARSQRFCAPPVPRLPLVGDGLSDSGCHLGRWLPLGPLRP